MSKEIIGYETKILGQVEDKVERSGLATATIIRSFDASERGALIGP